MSGPITLLVNGKQANYKVDKGYAIITKNWKKGDQVKISFPMPVQRILANQKVTANIGKVALQRGPVVYCAEWSDFQDKNVLNLVLDKNVSLTSEYKPDMLGGIEVLTGEAKNAQFISGNKTEGNKIPFTAIPYFAWANRGPGEMSVWLATQPEAARPVPAPTIAFKSMVTSSVKAPNLNALKDQDEPANSSDRENIYFHWWPIRDSVEWIQYTFEKQEKVSVAKVYWYDDGPWGECRVPEWWKLYYQTSDGKWQEVKTNSPYSVDKDKYVALPFDAVETRAMKLEVKIQKDFSSGLFEWVVE